MKKRVTLLLLAALTTLMTGAQSISKQINDIKRSDAYLSAEATLETTEKAYALAQELLSKQIEEYAASQKSLKKAPNVIVKDVAGKAEQLQMNRGQMVRVFLYVKKSDIIAANNTQVLVKSDSPLPSPPRGEGVDTPAITTTQTTVPTTAKPIAETPIATTPVAATPASAEPTASKSDHSLPSGRAGEGAAGVGVPSWQQSVINELMGCATATEVQQKLNRLRATMKVKRYGAPDTCRKPADAFWIIIDANAQVKTILGPADNGQRMNFRTGDYDALSAYTGMGSIWFTL